LKAGELRGVDAPREELLDLVDGMIGDAGEHVAEITLRIETIELRRFDEGVGNPPIFSGVG
jgi:hypothetical protein